MPGQSLPDRRSSHHNRHHRRQRHSRVGRVTDLVWSPRLERNIGYVWVPAELAGPGNDLEIEWANGQRTPAQTAAIPFLDPHKTVPTG